MSLERVLETEAMDTAEEAKGYDAMDHAEVNRAFVADLLAAGARGDVLDLGTGTAQIPIELCRRTADCRVMAVDLSVSMLDLARLNVEIATLTERIQLAHLDGKELPYEDGYFDAVMSNSIVHHIPQPLSVLKEVARVVRPGGLLFFRDLLRPEDEAAVASLVATYAKDAEEHQRQMFADSLRASLTLEEISALVAKLGFDPTDVRQTSDRHWTWATWVPRPASA